MVCNLNPNSGTGFQTVMTGKMPVPPKYSGAGYKPAPAKGRYK